MGRRGRPRGLGSAPVWTFQALTWRTRLPYSTRAHLLPFDRVGAWQMALDAHAEVLVRRVIECVERRAVFGAWSTPSVEPVVAVKGTPPVRSTKEGERKERA